MSGLCAPFGNATEKRVTIIGAGNTGCALLADLKQRGFSVCLYSHPDHSTRLHGIASRGKMRYSGMIEGECSPDQLTTDEKVALTFSDDIILALPLMPRTRCSRDWLRM